MQQDIFSLLQSVCFCLLYPDLYVIFYKYQRQKGLNDAPLFLNRTSGVCFGAARLWISAGSWRVSKDEEWTECYSVTKSVLVVDPSLRSRIQFGWMSVWAPTCPPSLSQQSQNYFVRFVSAADLEQFRRGEGRLLAEGISEIVGKLFCRWRWKVEAGKKGVSGGHISHLENLLSVLWLISDFIFFFLSLSFFPSTSPTVPTRGELSAPTPNTFPLCKWFLHRKAARLLPINSAGPPVWIRRDFFPLCALLFSIFVKRMSYLWCIAMVFPSLQWGERRSS